MNVTTPHASSRRTLLVLLVLASLGAWVIAAVVVATKVLLGLHTEAASSQDSLGPAGTVVISADHSVLIWALPLLLVTLAIVAVAWAIAFAARGYRRSSSWPVIGLFVVAFVSVGISHRPFADAWWQPVVGQDLGPGGDPFHFLIQDQLASAALLFLAAASGIALWIVALQRRTATVGDPVHTLANVSG